MRFRHTFLVAAPQFLVADFHRSASSLIAITPPPLQVRLLQAPAELQDNDEMKFQLVVGPLQIPWTARIEAVGPQGFTDRQLAGPFKAWVHRHSFLPFGPQSTLVLDEVEAELDSSPLHALLGLGMWLGLPLLFTYRAWKTRQTLGCS